MKERTVIGLLVVAGIGVAAYVVSLPEEGTLDWHKREYLRVRKQVERRTMRDQFERLYVRIRKPRNYRFSSVPGDELRKHKEALVRLGFLEEKRVQVGQPFAAQLSRILDEGRAVIPEERLGFVHLSVPPVLSIPSYVYITAPRENIAVWERLIRKTDAATPPIHLFEESDMTNDSLLLRAPERLPSLEKLLRKPE
jgi:hypothetical protein